MMHFFYRFNHMSLIPGSKQAGFTVEFSTSVLKELSATPRDPGVLQSLTVEMRGRLLRAALLPKAATLQSCIQFREGSFCPLGFATDPVFGASVSADPEEMRLLPRPDALEYIGSTMTFTPHNVDSPRQALALVVMVETWAEWAYALLQRAESSVR